MTSHERIKRTLDFKIPDRVGIYDNLPCETIKKWNKKDFPEFDLALFCIDKFDEAGYKTAKAQNLFLTVSLSDPFQKAVNEMGLEDSLLLLAKDPKKAIDIFSANTESALKRGQALFDKGFSFDGVWLWADLAYKNSTYFSIDTYKRLLHPYHLKLCRYFSGIGMPVIFHCDGDCRSLVPLLLNAGVRALNPLEIDCGFNLEFLKKEYGKDLVLFGNMPAAVLEKDKKEIEKVFKERLKILKSGGGFIYHCDNPIPETVSLENYQFALEMVKEYGAY